ncbi:MAG: glycosyltransferase [Candidatus Aminicenantes bacterium]|nr:glycosyltransferase [Candidatus Aminicenantes bacterium]
MRIGLDLRPFLKDATGIGVYYRNLLFSLAEIDITNEYFLFSSSFKDRFPVAQLPPFQQKRVCDRRWPSQLVNWLWSRMQRPRLETIFKIALDLTHSPTPLLLPSKGKSIVTVHDLFFWEHPEMVDRKTRNLFLKYTRNSLRQADGVIAVSQYTKDEAVRRFALDPDKVRVIHHGLKKGLDPDETGVMEAVLKSKFRLPDRFLLFVGADEPRKNLPALIDALKLVHEMSEKIVLVVAGGKGSDRTRVEARITSQNLTSSVRFLGYLSDAELSALYRLATLVVLPSLCEGFGFPLLEAMASGVPIVASETSALPEIGQDAARYFDPSSAEAISQTILQVLEDESLQQKLVERGRLRLRDFSWTRSAEQTLDFYSEVVAGGSL